MKITLNLWKLELYQKKKALDKAGKKVCDNYYFEECAEEATMFSRDYFTGKIDSSLCEVCADRANDRAMEQLIEDFS